MPNFSNTGLRSVYDGIWERSRDRLLANDIQIDPEPAPGVSRWGVSAVVRPMELHDISKTLDALRPSVGPDHFFYDRTNIHITLRSIEGYRGPVEPDDPSAAVYVRALKKLAPMLAGLQIELCGLTANASTVLLQGWPDNALQSFREALFEALQPFQPSVGGPETRREGLRVTAHATLIMFTGPLANPHEVARLVEANRSRPFGMLAPRWIDLVYYRRTLHSVSAETIERIAISGAG